MGGARVHHESVEELLDAYPPIKKMFEQAGWIDYIRRFQGHDNDIALEFSMHYREGRSEVAGTVVHATEEAISEVSGLLQTGEKWFAPRKPQPDVVRNLLEASEQLIRSGSGYERKSLPQPWSDVAFLV